MTSRSTHFSFENIKFDSFANIYLAFSKKKNESARIRAWNPFILSQMPYPLGHGATHGTVILSISHSSGYFKLSSLKMKKKCSIVFSQGTFSNLR